MSTILIVDDDPSDQEILRAIFKHYDPTIKIIAVEGCNLCMRLIKEHTIDCIFLDQKLKGISGIDCLQKLRGELFFQGIVIIFTGYLEEHVVSEALRFGADDFVLKNLGNGMDRQIIQAYESAMSKRNQALERETKIRQRKNEFRQLTETLNATVARLLDFMKDENIG
jgi:DNA-binding NtrC family response regulator